MKRHPVSIGLTLAVVSLFAAGVILFCGNLMFNRAPDAVSKAMFGFALLIAAFFAGVVSLAVVRIIGEQQIPPLPPDKSGNPSPDELQ